MADGDQVQGASSVNQYQADQTAEQTWRRYQYGLQRGHRTYVRRARRLEGFYLGGGLQWTAADVQKLWESGKRPAYEFNGIMPAVNSAIGYQIHNRMDIQFLPRGGAADSALAQARSKVAMKICDDNRFRWVETQVFADGLIEQRGYFDVRMCFDDNIFGKLVITSADPRDVVPDPDAKGYDPHDWFDVSVTRWYTIDEIRGFYGDDAAKKMRIFLDSDADWGEHEEDGERNKFGEENAAAMWDAFMDDPDARRFRIIDRQRWEYKQCQVAIDQFGSIVNVDEFTPDRVQQMVQEGYTLTKRLTRTVRWTASSRFVTLFDDTSPYDRFTIVPFFCLFRRGTTRGMVDNAISPQEVLNKAISQFVHIINGTSNSGWVVEENSLVNLLPEDLEEKGSTPGLLIIYKQGSKTPEKILPNAAPPGMDRLIELAYQHLKDVTVPDAARGLETPEISGIAIQTKQFASQQQMAVPLDNLARTRHMVAEWIDYAIATFYTAPMVFRVTETDPTTGQDMSESLSVNQYVPTTGKWLNDMTAGEFDVVINEVPTQVTFENSQVMQAIEMRKIGVQIPDSVIVKHSNLADKTEILSQMANAPQSRDPLNDAKASLANAQASVAQAMADKTQAETANVRVTSLFGATQAAQAIALNPSIAPLADQLARSAGVRDQDAAPLIGGPPPGTPLPAPTAVVPPNTDPLTPAHPATGDVGARAGIEGGQQP